MQGVRRKLIKKSTGALQLTYVGEILSGGGWDPKMDHLVCFLPGTLALGASQGAAPTGVALQDRPCVLSSILSIARVEGALEHFQLCRLSRQ